MTFLIRLLKKVKYNFNYVGFSGYVDHSNKKKTMNSHFQGCKNLIDIFKNRKINNFIQIGSSLEYGSVKSPHKETIPCKPNGNCKQNLKPTNYLKKWETI